MRTSELPYMSGRAASKGKYLTMPRGPFVAAGVLGLSFAGWIAAAFGAGSENRDRKEQIDRAALSFH